MIDDADISEPNSGNDTFQPTACVHEGKDDDGILISSNDDKGFVKDTEITTMSDPEHSESYRSVEPWPPRSSSRRGAAYAASQAAAAFASTAATARPAAVPVQIVIW